MEFLIISGLSGGGKSRVAAVLEDLDFYCVDNMPVVLMPRFAELCLATKGRYERVALVTDIRGGAEGLGDLFRTLNEMKEMGCDYKILFIEAALSTIVRRYKESRRRHPLDPDGVSTEAAIRREIEILRPIRDQANYLIDTSDLTLGALQRKLFRMFVGNAGRDNAIRVNVISFGFKYGIPMESDLVFDVRYLPNPFYLAPLRGLTGLDKPVSDFVFSHEQAVGFMERLTGMIDYLLPMYVEEGKYSLTISIGCTGGHHRSVAIAEALGGFIRERGHTVTNVHRDIEK